MSGTLLEQTQPHSTLLVPILLFLVTFFVLRRFLAASTPASKRRPPSPPTLPVIGNLHQIGTYAHRSLQSLSKRYGPVMLLRFGSALVLVVSSREFAREVIKTHDLVLADRPLSDITGPLLYNGRDISAALTASTGGS
ncbi:hypothetical protein MLD38_039414 [Melastoma candidum]|uniref:Uncharacterized protein n=1 Tax=Melastoma candidum TaxID=119954 RepID=A0ACB9L2Q8_9MYRT|nr:hypothetical protein MLD38_039414 [Melastoma candidum]